MKIILTEAYENGARPALQDWSGEKLPGGYAWCPNEFVGIFYSTDPAGFVNITVENDTVTAMSVNQAAYDAYVASLPDEPDEPATEPTAEELIDIMLGVSRYE